MTLIDDSKKQLQSAITLITKKLSEKRMTPQMEREVWALIDDCIKSLIDTVGQCSYEEDFGDAMLACKGHEREPK